MAERKQRTKPDVSMGQHEAVTQFIRERHWTVLSGGELPYPVAVSLGIGSGGRLRCTGLVIGMPSPGGDAGGAQPIEITSASLRDIRITELLGAIMSPSDDEPDVEKMLQALISFSGPGKGRPLLDRLYPGMMPDLPPAGPQIRGQALPREHFVRVAAEYRLARVKNPGAPMRELMRRLSIWKGREIPEPTARRWVQRARDMGILGPSHSGKAGEYPPAT